MSFRGPDDSGFWIREHVALGHRRLAVIDIPGGVQPMTARTAGGTVAMVYDGEVYNYRELRTELIARGHRFATASDTAVVLHAYLEWGERVAEHLNGMFAFAVWDERRDKLVLVRDRLGIKPLYYYPTRDGGLLFGSEPKAIFAHPDVERAVDLAGLRELVAFTRTPDWGFWRGMHELEPGTVLTADAGGIRTHRYWTLRNGQHPDDRGTTVDTVRTLLTDIVERQLVADVPRCVLLSGGLDSSTIAGLAAAHLARRVVRVRTFSVDFPGQEENFQPHALRGTPDAPYVREVVKRIDSVHRDVVINPAQHSDPVIRRAVIAARDIPSGLGDVDTSLYLLFQAIRSESKVALSGESADEVFAGYPWHHEESVRAAGTFPWLAFHSLTTSRLDTLHPAVRDLLEIDTYTADEYATAVAAVEHLPETSELERRTRTICHLFLTRWLRMALDRKDRLSMAAGVEVRVPFCDHRLVEYVYRTPWSDKTFDGREKSLLRAAAAHVLPARVAWRRKSGYPTIQDLSYSTALQQQAKELLTEPNHPVFDLLDRDWLYEAVQCAPAAMRRRTRLGLDWALELYHWFDIYRPQLVLE
jgi:asparagine synthase (glutamine-hydrolysing)